MFLSFNCIEALSGEIHPEILTVYGVRYNRNNFAVLSTEHRMHDYLLPMKSDQYEEFVKELEKALAEAKTGVRLTGGEVYRVRHGAILPMEDKVGMPYKAEGF
ncbi:MAG: hypothetical protein K6E50_01015 [Lachnospiraceae bacterium]|nr:hypothetical protein [Lachnospiraceae bacterium]